MHFASYIASIHHDKTYLFIFFLIVGTVIFFKDLFKKNQSTESANQLPVGATASLAPTPWKYLILLLIAGTVFNVFLVGIMYCICDNKEHFWDYLVGYSQIFLGMYVCCFIGGMVMYALLRNPPK